MIVSTITLGCPKNVVDSEILKGRLFGHSVEFTEKPQNADVVIINTCAFILPAREEAIETILEAVELKKNHNVKKIYVVGCLPQKYSDELKTEIPEVDGFFADKDFSEIGNEIARELHLSKGKESRRRVTETPGHYGYLKISDGCDNKCLYCTIPQIKGKHQSQQFSVLMEEAKEIARNGVKELILVAQDITYYGWDSGNKQALPKLIKSLAKIDKIEWIRLLYAHPAHVNDDLINLFKEEEKICRYIDLPIQHISDNILKAMGRKTSSRSIQELIQKLRNNVPGIGIRTTIMVGYPGETEEDFEYLKKFVAETEFERLGVFKFIPEEGTGAARMKHQISETVKEDRMQELMELQYEIAYNKNSQLSGKSLRVIVDEKGADSAFYSARTQWDSPLIDNIVHVQGNLEPGKFYDVKIDQTDAYELWGTKIH